MNDTILAKAYADELDMEARATERSLEPYTANLFDYKPHEKSMQMGYLALLVAEIPLWIAYMLTEGDIDLMTFPHAKINSGPEMVQHFKENVAKAKAALLNVQEGDLDKEFNLKRNGEVVWNTKIGFMISNSINHMVHHRGQLTVYLRLNDLHVPSLYGPSADEKTF